MHNLLVSGAEINILDKNRDFGTNNIATDYTGYMTKFDDGGFGLIFTEKVSVFGGNRRTVGNSTFYDMYRPGVIVVVNNAFYDDIPIIEEKFPAISFVRASDLAKRATLEKIGVSPASIPADFRDLDIK